MSKKHLTNIGVAAWKLEDALSDRLVKEYPCDPDARATQFKLAKAEAAYRKALLAMVVLTIFEVPSWCDTTNGFFTYMDPAERCTIPGVDQDYVLLSGVPFIPPGWGIILELWLVLTIARKYLLDWFLQTKYFDPLGGANRQGSVEYVSLGVVKLGLSLAALELIDGTFFVLYRPGARIAFLARAGYLCLVPGVKGFIKCIWAVIGEFVSVAIFLVGTIAFFAWIAVTLFSTLDDLVDGVPVNKGFATYSEALNTMFVAGSTDDFVSCFLRPYTMYRRSGLLWLLFLVIVQVLFLSVVLATLVSAYTNYTEEEEETFLREKAQGIMNAFNTLTTEAGEEDLSKAAFIDFAREFGSSPNCRQIPESTAEIMFTVADKDRCGFVGRREFVELCSLLQYNFWTTRIDSPLKDWCPDLWEHPSFVWFRRQVVTGSFDWSMNLVLFVNLGLVVAETVYDLNAWPENALMENLELVFSLIYVMEVLLRLCVNSWGEYWSLRSNQFDFFTTWALLGSSVLEEVVNDVVGTGANVKRYMNILRLLRLLRVIKQIKRVPAVQFMVDTIIKLVLASADILMLLGVVIFFFTTLSVQLFGGLLYETNPALSETEWVESKFFVLNFNDCLMAFGAWVVMLLCEYVAQFPDAIAKSASTPGIWLVFPIFYVCGVSIVFELVQAFTIEVFMDLNGKRGKDETEFKALKDLEEDFEAAGRRIHYRIVGDVMTQEKMHEILGEMAAEEEEQDGCAEEGKEETAKAAV